LAPEQGQAEDEPDDEGGREAELDHGIAERLGPLVDDLGELRGEHERAPDARDEPDYQERLGNESDRPAVPPTSPARRFSPHPTRGTSCHG